MKNIFTLLAVVALCCLSVTSALADNLPPPDAVYVVVSGSSVTVSWTMVTGADHYMVNFGGSNPGGLSEDATAYGTGSSVLSITLPIPGYAHLGPGDYSICAKVRAHPPLQGPNGEFSNQVCGTFTIGPPPVVNSTPSIECAGGLSANTAGQCGAFVTWGAGQATASGIPAPTVTYSPPSGSFFPVGTTTVTATATNIAGTDVCTFTVTVVDGEKPVITPIQSIAQGTDPNACSAVVTFNVNATDNCPGGLIVVATPPSGSTFSTGTTTVNVTATDASGNSSTTSFTVTVNDNQAPSIATPASIVTNTDQGACSAVVSYVVTATDNCLGDVNITSSPASGFAFPKGTTTVNITATDANSNVSHSSFTVTVEDHEAPVANAGSLPDVIAQCSANLPAPPTATDNCAGQLTGSPSLTGPFGQGDYTITWTYSDGNGNSSTQIQAVHVHDTQAPVANAGALPDVIEQCSALLPAAPTATDNCAGQLTGSSDQAGPFGQGDYTITWTYSDGNGNSSTQTQAIHVHDTELPTISAPAPITVNNDPGLCSASNVNLGNALANDNCTGWSVSNNAPVSYPVGTTVVTWTVTDAVGHTATATQVVTVKDVEAPVITVPGTYTGAAACANILRATATDNCVGNVSVSNNAPPYYPTGTTTVTWTATDGVNSSSATQLVVISSYGNASWVPPITLAAGSPGMVKKGSTLPVKFIFGCNYPLAGGTITVTNMNPLSTAQPNLSTSFRWTGSLYIYNLDTGASPYVVGQTYTVVAYLNDGNTLTGYFKISK
jgi:hypothetical protein